MSNYTITIRTFLLSHFKDEHGKRNGYGLDIDGNFYHPNVIINNTYNKVFEQMELHPHVSEEFKKAFCKRFYNSEIGFETWARFNIALEQVLNNDCYNLFKVLNDLRNLTDDDITKNMVIENNSNTNANNKAVNLVETRAGESKEIIFTENYGIIEHANNVAETHSKQDVDNSSVTKGQTGSTKMERLLQLGYSNDIITQILNKCEHLFMGVL